MKNIVGITMGDPAGISPEIIIKSFAQDPSISKQAIVIGSSEILHLCMEKKIAPQMDINIIQSAAEASFSSRIINIIDIPLQDISDFSFSKVQAQAGDLAYRCIEKATQLAQEGEIKSIATAPLNKEAMHLAGHHFPGHTELLANLTKTKDYAMLLYTDNLKVIHVTTHVSMLNFLQNLNSQRIATVIELADSFLKRLGYKKPKIAVAGVNPHAGENGLFGQEEIEVINPIIKKMQEQGFDVEGSCPPDTVFLKTAEGEYDIVVAMYHDQGHIPLKLMGFHDGVNITAGLPFLRTSADHGTAFDIAWQGKANPESMMTAIKLAIKLSD